jgi:hypothetical protein
MFPNILIKQGNIANETLKLKSPGYVCRGPLMLRYQLLNFNGF